MNTSAIFLMVISMILVWGGLIAAVLFLRARPEVTDLADIDDETIVIDDTRDDWPHPTRDT